MNDDVIVAAYVAIDEIMQALGHTSHPLAQISDAEVLTVAVVAAREFQNDHARALRSAKDEASILADTGVRLVPIRRANMRPNTWADKLDLRALRKRIETTGSQLEAMGLQRLRARTNSGFAIKVQASLLALACTNAH